MSNPEEQAFAKIMQWAERNPDAHSVPWHIQAEIDKVDRYDKVNSVEVSQYLSHDEIELARDELSDMMEGYQKRREMELLLADYIEGVARRNNRVDLLGIAGRLRDCRQSGPVAQKPDGGLMIAWDSKCGLVKLCPDESREETQRLNNFYNDSITDFLNEHPTHRAFYMVPTTRNYPPGELLHGKNDIFEKFNNFIRPEHEYCKVGFNEGAYCVLPKRYKSIQPISKTKGDPIANFKGSLVVQEDPLSSSGWWNVHLNVILLVKGELNYKKVREEWGTNLFIQEIAIDDDVENKSQAIKETILELIKYGTLIVGVKSEDKAKNGTTSAPGITDWPDPRFIEWWDSHRIPTGQLDKPFKTFRRVRSYGCLYAVHGKRWDAMTRKERVIVVRDAGIEGLDAGRVARCAWKDIYKDEKKKFRNSIKVKLRKAMLHGEGLDLDEVVWIGSVVFTGSGYSVSLILGDNFLSDSKRIKPPDKFQQRFSSG